MMRGLFFVMAVFVIVGCGRKGVTNGTIGPGEGVNHATGFTVERLGDVTILTLRDPQGNGVQEEKYALVPRGSGAEVPMGMRKIEVPVRRVVCMTSLQLSNFIALGLEETVVGVSSTRHLHNARLRKQLADGRTRRIGIEGNFDPEVIMALEADLIIISPYKRGGYDALREVGIPLLPHFGYQETTPLGQAEWVKCVGLMMGHEAEADSVFAGIEERYAALKALTHDVEERPAVLSGELRGGNWYAVGGESYLARLFEDAGADYFLKDDARAGGVTMDFEEVYDGASGAQFWRILNSFDGEFGYEALGAQDARYQDFKAWRERGIVYCNMRKVPFYEKTPMEPDVVLADMIKAFHPTKLPDYEPVYYKMLK